MFRNYSKTISFACCCTLSATDMPIETSKHQGFDVAMFRRDLSMFRNYSKTISFRCVVASMSHLTGGIYTLVVSRHHFGHCFINKPTVSASCEPRISLALPCPALSCPALPCLASSLLSSSPLVSSLPFTPLLVSSGIFPPLPVPSLAGVAQHEGASRHSLAARTSMTHNELCCLFA